jgi:sortase A
MLFTRVATAISAIIFDMLRLEHKRTWTRRSSALLIGALFTFGAGIYLLSLVMAPAMMPYLPVEKLDIEEIAKQQPAENKIIIPKIGVNIEYGEGEAALDQGAQWRYPDRGNPASGGNFIIAAHRLELAPTPMETVRKSPFYHIDKLELDDEIIIDYDGTRYGYKISRIYDVKPTQVEIESPSETPKLTMYTCTLGGASDGRVVVEAEPVGEVTIIPDDASRS